MPSPWITGLDDSGLPLSGGLLYTYAAGTSTPLTTYSDSALTTPNSNPVVLDTAGRATLYLSAASYKLVLKTAAGVTIRTQDNVSSIALLAAASALNDVCCGRLTLTAGTPATTADVTAATTIYFSPYGGNRITLYDGSSWAIYSFSELSIALGTDTASKPYDVFAYLNAGAVAIERLAWTNDTTRATALILQDGVKVKSGDATRRYLGTYRTTAVAGQTEDSAANRLVKNYYHKVLKVVRVIEATNNWAYTTDTWRQVRASTANQIGIVNGVAEDAISLQALAFAANTNAGVILYTGIGDNATTAPTSNGQPSRVDTYLANGVVTLPAFLTTVPNEGYRFYAWLERSEATGTTTWLGDNGDNQKQQAAMFGTWLC